MAGSEQVKDQLLVKTRPACKELCPLGWRTSKREDAKRQVSAFWEQL
jgi:hypothetical protein